MYSAIIKSPEYANLRIYSLHYEIGGVFNRAAIMSIGVGQSSPFWWEWKFYVHKWRVVGQVDFATEGKKLFGLHSTSADLCTFFVLLSGFGKGHSDLLLARSSNFLMSVILWFSLFGLKGTLSPVYSRCESVTSKTWMKGECFNVYISPRRVTLRLLAALSALLRY